MFNNMSYLVPYNIHTYHKRIICHLIFEKLKIHKAIGFN